MPFPLIEPQAPSPSWLKTNNKEHIGSGLERGSIEAPLSSMEHVADSI